MAASKYTQRLRALEYAIASSSQDDTPQDVVRRGQIYADWLSGVFTVPLEYQVNDTPPKSAENVLPMKPKGKS
jgi:hypothetical protein